MISKDLQAAQYCQSNRLIYLLAWGVGFKGTEGLQTVDKNEKFFSFLVKSEVCLDLVWTKQNRNCRKKLKLLHVNLIIFLSCSLTVFQNCYIKDLFHQTFQEQFIKKKSLS